MDTTDGIWNFMRRHAARAAASMIPGGALAFDLAADVLPDFVSQSVAAKIKDAAMFQAYQIMAKTHKKVLMTLVWQNALLLMSLPLVSLTKSSLPFYGAYAGVLGYTIWSTTKAWPLIRGVLVTRSLRKTIARAVAAAIRADLLTRDAFQRTIVDWFGPDLDKIADEIAIDLVPDVRTYVLNLAFTLSMAFVTFRWFLIPALEQQALR